MIRWSQIVALVSRVSLHSTYEHRCFSEQVSSFSEKKDDQPTQQRNQFGVDPKEYLDISIMYEEIMNRAPVQYRSGIASYKKSPGPTHWSNPFFSNSFLYDPLSQKFINKLMVGGDKSKAQQLFSQALERIRTKLIKAAHISHPDSLSPPDQIDPVKYFHQALSNVMPLMQIMSIGSMRQYSVPVKMSDTQRLFKAMRWLVDHAREIGATNEKMDSKLAKAFELAYNKKGTAYQTKIQLNKLCVVNRAHAAFRYATRQKSSLSRGKRRKRR